MAQDSTATGLFVLSWLAWLLALVLLVASAVTAIARSSGPDAVPHPVLAFLVYAGYCVVLVLMGLLTRWMAKGVLALRKGRILAASVYAAAWGLALLLAPAAEGAVSTTVSIRTLGIACLLGSALLAWLLFAKAQVDQ